MCGKKKGYVLQSKIKAALQALWQVGEDLDEKMYQLVTRATSARKQKELEEQARSHRAFLEHDFVKKLDRPEVVANLFPFSDGFVDLMRGGTLRRYTPEMGVSLTTGYPYPTQISEEHLKTIISFFKDVLPVAATRSFFLDCLAQCLRHHDILCCIGNTRNGKGVATKLIKNAFGDLAGELEYDNLASAGGPEKPRSSITTIQNKRIVFVNEAAKPGVKLDEAYLNQLSGGDAFSMRGLHENMRSVKPQFTMVFSLNDPMKVSGTRATDALQERVKGIKFPKTFYDKSDPRYNSEDPFIGVKDPTLEARFSKMRDAMIGYLLDRFPKLPNPREIPDEVRGTTMEMRVAGDKIAGVLDSLVCPTSMKFAIDNRGNVTNGGDEEPIIVASDIADALVESLQSEHGDKISKADARREVERRFGAAYQKDYNLLGGRAGRRSGGTFNAVRGYLWKDDDFKVVVFPHTDTNGERKRKNIYMRDINKVLNYF